jgi:nicotinamidase-related amidase
MAWARLNNIPVISTCEIYSSNGNGNGNGNGHAYCIAGTEGQKKIKYTLNNSRISFAADDSTDLPTDVLLRYNQIVLHQRCTDPFDEPRIERLLTEIKADEFIIIGANTEDSVKSAVLGLLQRGKKVIVVIDALGLQDKHKAKMAIRKMEAKGAKVIETKKLAGVSHLRQVGACDCPSCQGQTRKTQKEHIEIGPSYYS